jgi:hypothetical protein
MQRTEIFTEALAAVRQNNKTKFFGCLNRRYGMFTSEQLHDFLIEAVLHNANDIVNSFITDDKLLGIIDEEIIIHRLLQFAEHPNSKMEFYLAAGHIPATESNFVPTEILHMLNDHISRLDIFSNKSTDKLITTFINNAITKLIFAFKVHEISKSNIVANNINTTIGMLKAILQIPGLYQGQYAYQILQQANAKILQEIGVPFIKEIIRKGSGSYVCYIRNLASEETDYERAKILYYCAYSKEDLDKIKELYTGIKENILAEIAKNAKNRSTIKKIFNKTNKTEYKKAKIFQEIDKQCRNAKTDIFTQLEHIQYVLLCAYDQYKGEDGDDVILSMIRISRCNMKLSPELAYFQDLDRIYAKEQQEKELAKISSPKM